MPKALGLFRPTPARTLARVFAALCASFAVFLAASGQPPPASAPPAGPAATAPNPEPPPRQTESSPPAAPNTTSPAPAPESPQPGALTEDDLKKLLVGKTLYLRGGYLDDTLAFNEHGVLSGHSPQGSYTLSGVSIDKVRLTKHKVELEGQRYGLHFLGALPSEDPSAATDRVLITPKKKFLRITIDREAVITPKKIKDKARKSPAATSAPSQPAEPSEADQAKAEISAVPPAERPADPASVTTTTSPAHAAAILKEAIERIFSVGFDERMMAAMPDFWKLYYQAVAAKADYRPTDPSVLRQTAVDKKARLKSVFEPASNEYAQSHGVAGLALYHVVIGPDGKPAEIAVARPIGFGLDESAVDSIRKAAFEPAVKNGQPVPVLLDLIVEFHIYSGLTGASGKPPAAPTEVAKQDASAPQDKPASPVLLPGPYSVPHH
jgi:outer membrane biosynthesis protein TonB